LQIQIKPWKNAQKYTIPFETKTAASYKCSTSINTFYFSLFGKQCILSLLAAAALVYLARHFHSIQADAIPIVRDGGRGENHMKFH